MKTTVTTKNMVTIPAELSRRLGISPGCQLDWEAVSGNDAEIRVRVIPKRGELARRLMGRAGKWSPERDAVRELIEERAREDREQGPV
jgi:AbrB family looped-hinge helix DNA binding protein